MEKQYQYDKRNRLTVYTKGGISKEYEYDNAGNLIRDSKAKYEYDAFNRNTKAETFNGNIQINRYDAEGLRHEMEENGRLVSFIFRGTEIVAEETKEDKIRYIRTGELLASDAESARTYYHYASDEMGSITHVVDAERGNVLNHYEYDAWGNPVVCEEKVENRFKFNGQQYDPISQQYYLRARYYNPVIARFTQEDTYRGDGLNLYAYCKNNPVYYVDPSGNYVCPSGVERISNAINERKATPDDVKQISSHLREKIKNRQDLTPTERNIANQFGMDTSKSGSGTEIVPYYPSNDGAVQGTKHSEYLMPGDIIDRYGKTSGKYFSPSGTPLDMRALPYDADLSQYRQYEVLKPFEVEASTIAPAFAKIGLGTQYRSSVSAEVLVKKGIIKLVGGYW